jgi:hypothetical protein
MHECEYIANDGDAGVDDDFHRHSRVCYSWDMLKINTGIIKHLTNENSRPKNSGSQRQDA